MLPFEPQAIASDDQTSRQDPSLPFPGLVTVLNHEEELDRALAGLGSRPEPQQHGTEVQVGGT